MGSQIAYLRGADIHDSVLGDKTVALTSDCLSSNPATYLKSGLDKLFAFPPYQLLHL